MLQLIKVRPLLKSKKKNPRKKLRKNQNVNADFLIARVLSISDTFKQRI